MDPHLAECVGLWLAEGDRKTKAEITFTNNCWKLIELFHKVVISKYAGNPRIYVYSPPNVKTNVSLDYCKIKHYTHKRATRPYYILRLASVKAVRDWKNNVDALLKDPQLYADILRGFFAGEGNIKTGSHSNRTVRIAQKEPIKFVNDILAFYNITWSFSKSERSYVITGIWNWKKPAKLKVADLHPEKKYKFWQAFDSFKEEHYPIHQIRDELIGKLARPHTNEEIANKVGRSKARVYDLLGALKKDSILTNFRVQSKDFWVRTDANIIVISNIKKNYLNALEGKRTYEIAKLFKVDSKSAGNRLRELAKLGLAERREDLRWRVVPTDKEIVVK